MHSEVPKAFSKYHLCLSLMNPSVLYGYFYRVCEMWLCQCYFSPWWMQIKVKLKNEVKQPKCHLNTLHLVHKRGLLSGQDGWWGDSTEPEMKPLCGAPRLLSFFLWFRSPSYFCPSWKDTPGASSTRQFSSKKMIRCRGLLTTSGALWPAAASFLSK